MFTSVTSRSLALASLGFLRLLMFPPFLAFVAVR